MNEQPYGNYETAQLRGLGVEAPGSLFAGMDAIERLDFYQRLPASMKAKIPQSLVNQLKAEAATLRSGAGRETPPSEDGYRSSRSDIDRDSAAEAAAAAAANFQPSDEDEEGFFDKKLGPIPLWAVIGGGVLAAGGGAWWFMRKKR